MMKTPLILLALGSMMTCGLRTAQSQVYPQGVDAVMREPVTIPETAVDDALLALSRQANLNILMEVGRIPAGANLNQSAGLLYKVLAAAAQQHRLSWMRRDAKTVLLWPEPDVELLTQALLSGKRARFVGANPSTQESEQALGEYLRDAFGWTGNTPKFWKRAKIAVLPPLLRSKVVAWAQHDALDGPVSPRADAVVFDDEAWDGARLFIVRDPVEVQPAPPSEHYLALQVTQKRFGSLIGLEFVDVGKCTVVPSLSTSAASAARAEEQRTTPAPLPSLRPGPAGAQSMVAMVSQETPQQDTPGQALIESEFLRPVELRRDVALTQRVSMEFKRSPLNEVLANLGARAGVRLSLSPVALGTVGSGRKAPTPQVTGRIVDTPVEKFMDDLAYLFHLRWTKGKTGEYQAHLSPETSLEKQLVQLGNFAALKARRLQEREEQRVQLTQAVLENVRFGELQSKNGVLVANLPPALQQQLQQFAESLAGLTLLQAHHRAVPAVIEENVLDMASAQETTAPLPLRSRILSEGLSRVTPFVTVSKMSENHRPKAPPTAEGP